VKRRTWAIATAIAVAAIIGLWQIDIVRQNAQIFWLEVTGRAWKLRGQVTQYAVWSPALREARSVYVYTPPGYAHGKDYPVLYLLHGSPGMPSDWLRYGRAPEEVERLAAARKVPPMIIVCPDGQGIGTLGDSEYIDAPSKSTGHGADPDGIDVGTFIWRDLPQWVDTHFRTDRRPQARILAGVSTGGYGAVNLALQHPDVFGAGLSFSGYFTASPFGWARPVWGRNPDKARLDAESPTVYVSGPRPAWKNLFIYVGDGLNERAPYPQQSALFVTKLAAAHIDYVHHRAPGKHSWDLWRSLLRDSLTDHFSGGKCCSK
jgi:enterochelin esterase-like enzyme